MYRAKTKLVGRRKDSREDYTREFSKPNVGLRDVVVVGQSDGFPLGGDTYH